jgi:uncharacterized protein YbaP (TraB family)
MPSVTRRRLLGTGLAATLLARLAHASQYASGPPLWIATRDAARVFLFGQMPVRADSRWLSRAVQQAFDASSELWTENPDLDTASVSQPASPGQRQGPKLSEVASQHDMARLHAVLARAAMAADALDGLPPTAAYPALSELADRAIGADYSAIPERVLKGRARMSGKAVHSEWVSFEEIAHYSDRLPVQERMQLDLELFRRELDDADDASSAAQRLEQWLAGDLVGLEALERHTRATYPLASRVIGAERNQRWVPRIHSIMDRTRSAFVCVGILHLVGPASIQAFLRKSGIEVHRA